ncbi:MAG: glycosyltransferase family 2 protein [Solirubrobacterales bacterium]
MKLSVVIPTRDRREELLRTLAALRGQRDPGGGFEVVVVDNGSSDASLEAALELGAGGAMRLRAISEPRPGPAAARNAGVAAASGEVILFLGDDMEPADPSLVDAHARLHRGAGDPRYGVLGHVAWSGRQEVTALMDWLGRTFQFDYVNLAPGRVAPSHAFWTAHVSLRRELFERAGGFDTRFPWAGVEDLELGLRLERLRGWLDYHPELLVLHTHPVELAGSLERSRWVGRSSALLHEIHPDWHDPGLAAARGPAWRALRLSTPLWRALAALAPDGRLREQAWRRLHQSAYARGFSEGPPTERVGCRGSRRCA